MAGKLSHVSASVHMVPRVLEFVLLVSQEFQFVFCGEFGEPVHVEGEAVLSGQLVYFVEVRWSSRWY